MDVPNWISRAGIPTGAPIESRARVLRMSVSYGTGADCAYCHKRIAPGEVVYEVDADVAAMRRTLHFHRVCLQLWEELLS